jgi:hypothetical protein
MNKLKTILFEMLIFLTFTGRINNKSYSLWQLFSEPSLISHYFYNI